MARSWNLKLRKEQQGSVILCAKWETALFYLFYAFAVLAGLNWLFVGIGEWSLVSAITGSRQLRGNNAGARVLYVIVGILTLASLALTLVFVFKNDPSCFVAARPVVSEGSNSQNGSGSNAGNVGSAGGNANDVISSMNGEKEIQVVEVEQTMDEDDEFDT